MISLVQVAIRCCALIMHLRDYIVYSIGFNMDALLLETKVRTRLAKKTRKAIKAKNPYYKKAVRPDKKL